MVARARRCRWLGLSLLLAGAAGAEPEALPQWQLRNQVAVRANPFGLFDEVRVGRRWPLFTSPHWLLAGSSYALSLNASVSPIFARAGASVDVQLLSFLNLSVIYEAGGDFGTLGTVQSVPSPEQARFSPQPLLGATTLLDAPATASGGAMHQLIVGAYVNLHLGKRVIVRSNNRLVFEQLALPAGQRAFFDPNWDIVLPNAGFISVNDVDLLVQPCAGLRVGARYNLTHAFFSSPAAATVATTQRMGPLVSYQFFEQPRAPFEAPTLSLVVNWYLEHPLRTGPVPYLGLAFSFRSSW